VRNAVRGKDHLGRFSGNKFGVVLTSCTGDELTVAAERLLAGVRHRDLGRSGRSNGDHRRRCRAPPRSHRA
jgi:GGDEF domain-containing protein